MHIEHAQRVAQHENANGDHEHGARRRLRLRYEPSQQAALPATYKLPLSRSKRERSEGRICAHRRMIFLRLFTSFVRSAPNVILLYLVASELANSPPGPQAAQTACG